MNPTTNKVDSSYKRMQIDWLNLKKIVLSTVQGGWFLYITLKFDYKFNS